MRWIIYMMVYNYYLEFNFCNIIIYMSYSNSLSLDWNGTHFILTIRNELDSSYNILYSHDGIQWSNHNIVGTNPYHTTWNGTQHIISGDSTGNVILKSNKSPTSYQSSLDTHLNPIYDVESAVELPNKIIFPENTLLAFGGNTNDSVKIAYSHDDGETWLASTNSHTVFHTKCTNAVWNGKLWVATGSGNNTLATSHNGEHWTGRGAYIFTDTANTVAWSDSLNMWVAGGKGQNSLAYSYDGIFWTSLGDSIFSEVLDCKWNGHYFVAGGIHTSNNSNTIAYSYDGKTWTAVSAFSTKCTQMVWNESYWVAIGEDATHNMAVSPDGIHWTLFTNVDIPNPSHISISNVNAITIIDASLNRVALTKTNDFAHMQLSEFSEHMNTAFSTSVFSFLGGAHILQTLDPETWPSILTGIDISGLSIIRGMAWNNPHKGCSIIPPCSIAVGEGNHTIAYSNDGILWKGLGKSIFTEHANKVVWNGKLWVAVGKGAYSIAYSYDGKRWHGISDSFLTEAYDIAWNGTAFVAVGYGNVHHMVMSFDGIVWRGVPNSQPLFSEHVSTITWTGKQWIAYGCGNGNTSSTAFSNNVSGWIWSETDPKHLAIEHLSNVTATIIDLSGSSGSSSIETDKTWESDASTYNASGEYIGTNRIHGVSGEWLTMQTSVPTKIQYYTLTWSQNASSPNEWYLYGLDASNEYTLIDHATNTNVTASTSVIRSIPSNDLTTTSYQFAFPSIYPSDNSFVTVSNIQLYSENYQTGLISKHIRPIVTKTHVLHPFLSTYRIYTLSGDEIPFGSINGAYSFTPSTLENTYTSTTFDGESLVLTDVSGAITYISNQELNTSHRIDTSFNGHTIQSGLDEIYSSCWNGSRILVAGKKGEFGAIEYHGPIEKETETGTFHECLRVESLFTRVNGVSSNSEYGFVSANNRIYLSPNDKVTIISPNAYSTMGQTQINMKITNVKQVQQIVLPSETVLVGILGPTGPRGPTGAEYTGPAGPAGIDNTEMGPAGIDAIEDPVGFMGPTGPNGLNGDRGISGTIGNTGPANTELWNWTDNTNTDIALVDVTRNVLIGNATDSLGNVLSVGGNLHATSIVTNDIQATTLNTTLFVIQKEVSDPTATGIDLSGTMTVSDRLIIGNGATTSDAKIHIDGNVYVSNTIVNPNFATSYSTPATITESGITVNYSNGDHVWVDMGLTLTSDFPCTITNLQSGSKLFTLFLYMDYTNSNGGRPICCCVVVNDTEYTLKMKEGFPTITSNTTLLVQEVQICMINSTIISTICINHLY